MVRLLGSQDFYPTPTPFLQKITAGVQWEEINSVLEPSAGKGNIAEFVQSSRRWRERELDLDCIEIEPDLRSILIGKNFRVIHDDFLTLHTYKHYDLILMNPPFSQGARHLLKALEVQSISGGSIICILNAETLRNFCTKERGILNLELQKFNAEIKFYQNAFSNAENPSDVEVAVVKVTVPAPRRHTVIPSTLREKNYLENNYSRENMELAETDFVASVVAQYNREIEWGLKLYDEFLELKAKSIGEETPINFSLQQSGFSVNGYVKEVRKKYWNKLFTSPNFTKKMTSHLQSEYLSKIHELVNYDFSYYNIKTIQIEITKHLIEGVEDCILNLFDEFSAQHSWDADLKNNIHYYNGWKTNLSWKINKRVVIILRGYDRYGSKYYYSPDSWEVRRKLADIEKVFNYLDNGETEELDLSYILKEAKQTGLTTKIQTKYFNVTFYKKGTCHLEFLNERLLKKFNIFGSQKKGWLPKGYAKRKYEEMTEEEQSVINDFEGRKSYQQTVQEANYYIFDAGRNIPVLGGNYGKEN